MVRSGAPPIHLSFNEPLTKRYECSEAYGCLFSIDAIQNKLPSPIHHGRLNHLIIRDTGVRFQDERQGEHRRGHWGRPRACF